MPTPGIKQLTREFVTAAKDFYNPMYAGLLRHQDETLDLKGGSKGLKIYDEILRDPHAWAVFQKRVQAVIARDWEVEPASSKRLDKKASNLVTQQLQALDLDGLTSALLMALLKGFAVAEILWEIRGSELVAARFLPRDPRLFQFKALDAGGYELRLRSLGNVEGEPVPDRKLLVFSWGSTTGNPYGLGLGTRLFWPCYFKRQLLGFWLDYCERNVTPLAVAQYPEGLSLELQDRLETTMAEWGQRAGVLVPERTQVELFSAPTAGQAYDLLTRYLDEEISKAVLGETLSTTMKQGSLAAAKVQNSVRLELVQADADLVCACLTESLIRWIVELNLPGAAIPRLRRIVKAEEDLLELAQRDKLIFEMGFKPTLASIHEKFSGEWTEIPLQVGAAQPSEAQPGTVSKSNPGSEAGKAQKPEVAEHAEGEEDPVDELTRQALQEAAPAIETLLNPIRLAVMSATSLENLRDTLDTLFPDLDGRAFAEVMTQALTLAGLMGRFEVLQDAAAGTA